jgi:hypothetical protein
MLCSPSADYALAVSILVSREGSHIDLPAPREGRYATPQGKIGCFRAATDAKGPDVSDIRPLTTRGYLWLLLFCGFCVGFAGLSWGLV